MATMLSLEEILPDAGAIELPDGIYLFCKECGRPTRDYGQHAVAKLVQGSISGAIKLMVDCEICGKYTECTNVCAKSRKPVPAVVSEVRERADNACREFFDGPHSLG